MLRTNRKAAVELRHLRYFVAVAEELHFGRAAERLYVVQPAVSEQVRKLEQELGVRLFDRTPRSVSLTSAGAALLEEARLVLRQAEVAKLAAQRARDRAMMHLRIGYLADSLPSVVPRALRHLAAAAPRVEVTLRSAPAHRLSDDLRARRLDAVVTSLPAPTSGLKITPLGWEGAVAAVPVTHAQALRPALVLEWVTSEQLLVLPREVNPAFHDAVGSCCRASGLSPAFVEVATVDDALMAATVGAGIALVPESVAGRYAARGIRFLPLEGAEPACQTAVLTDPDAENLAAATFLRALSRVATTRPVGEVGQAAGAPAA
jgi:DNA-binding transcriptional LysR family regulator